MVAVALDRKERYDEQTRPAIFAVSLLLITASSALITSGTSVNGTTDPYETQTPEFSFDGYEKTSSGPIDIYTMEKTVDSYVLFGNAIPEDCDDTVDVEAMIILNNDLRTIGFEIAVISNNEAILFFSDTITEDGISEENAWIYDGMTPTIRPLNFISDMQKSWSLIQELQDLLSKVSSKYIKENPQSKNERVRLTG